jgi:hypothetical protein
MEFSEDVSIKVPRGRPFGKATNKGRVQILPLIKGRR